MPPRRLPLAVLAAVLVAAVLTDAAVARGGATAPWRWPVRDGTVVSGFSYSPARPFAAGARRGIDLVAAAGAAVGAPCAGRVLFAGPVPGGARAVTVLCGDLRATHVGLARLRVRAGSRVRPGDVVGVLGRNGRLRLGARLASDRFGYVDPLEMLGARPGAVPANPGVPLGRAPGRPAGEAPRPTVTRSPRVPAPASAPAAAPVTPGARAGLPASAAAPPARIPAVAWAGIVLLAAGVPLGGLVRRSARRRTRAAATACAWGGGVREAG
jgi:murein DD-endopeptidase MepM/ murein hydrolase activator NlpD